MTRQKSRCPRATSVSTAVVTVAPKSTSTYASPSGSAVRPMRANRVRPWTNVEHAIVVQLHLHQQHAVDQPGVGQRHRLVGLVADRPQHELVAALLRADSGAGEEPSDGAAQRALQRGVQHPDDLGAAAGEGGSDRIATVAELPHRLLDARGRGGRDRLGAVHDERDRRHRDVRSGGDVVHGDHGRSSRGEAIPRGYGCVHHR